MVDISARGPSLHFPRTGGTAEPNSSDDPDTMEVINREVIESSQKAVLKVYGRAVDVLRDKRERELLAEALCDVGDLHVSEQCVWRSYVFMTTMILFMLDLLLRCCGYWCCGWCCCHRPSFSPRARLQDYRKSLAQPIF